MPSWDKFSYLAANRIPFLFIIDYDVKNVLAYPLDELHSEDIEFSIEEQQEKSVKRIEIKKFPISFQSYEEKFNTIIEEIKNGNTYLLNFTQPTPIEINADLKEIYNHSRARFKLRFKDKFVSFSPEPFVSIQDNKIETFPMKGTIDASIENAKEKILADKKELAEHIMIVDLLRNDLGQIGSEVKLEKFRYLEKVHSFDRTLLQVSSHISARLLPDWNERLGEIFKRLLPAGSISGTPKRSSCQIIDRVEGYNRGFFSGVFGVYDGETLKSSVLIRYIEKNGDKLLYKSGGGITLDSNALDEYRELNEKIYIPNIS